MLFSRFEHLGRRTSIRSASADVLVVCLDSNVSRMSPKRSLAQDRWLDERARDGDRGSRRLARAADAPPSAVHERLAAIPRVRVARGAAALRSAGSSPAARLRPSSSGPRPHLRAHPSRRRAVHRDRGRRIAALQAEARDPPQARGLWLPPTGSSGRSTTCGSIPTTRTRGSRSKRRISPTAASGPSVIASSSRRANDGPPDSLMQ